MIELIPLQDKYLEAVTEIAQESLPEHWSLKEMQDILRYDYYVYYLAYEKEKETVAGFAGIMLTLGEAELVNIAVGQSFRGQGIGQRLLDKLIAEAVERKADRMLLEVRQSNLPAMHLYKRNGFRILGERKAYYHHPEEDALIMERKL